MGEFISKFMEQWAMIRAAPRPHIVFVAIVIGAVWWLMGWRYDGIIANRDSTIANRDSTISLLTAQRDDYKDKLGGASPDEAKARIDALEKRLAQIEPRRLSEADKAKLLMQIPRSRKVSIVVQAGDADAADLSNEIKVFLLNSGYSVDPPVSMMMFGPNGTPRGVNINLNEAEPTNPVQITVGIR